MPRVSVEAVARWKQGSKRRADRAHIARLHEYLRQVKVARGCEDCGERDPAVLDFHHRDPATKVGSVRMLAQAQASKARLDAEMAKCAVLCCNCHLRRHHPAAPVASHEALRAARARQEE